MRGAGFFSRVWANSGWRYMKNFRSRLAVQARDGLIPGLIRNCGPKLVLASDECRVVDMCVVPASVVHCREREPRTVRWRDSPQLDLPAVGEPRQAIGGCDLYAPRIGCLLSFEDSQLRRALIDLKADGGFGRQIASDIRRS